MDDVIGREDELAAVTAFFDQPDDGLKGLVLEGEAGIGKTTLWRATVERAEQRGYLPLRCNPSGSEARLSFAALRDLLGTVIDDVAPVLPPPQRRALEVALLLRDPGRVPPSEETVATAFLTSLRALAADRAVLVAIDDVQSLDAPSASVLEFAVRRLEEQQVALVLARRTNGASGLPLGLDRALAAERRTVIGVGPLSLGALHQLVRVRLGEALPRPALRRVHDAAGGNPFFGLELARALVRHGGLAPGEPLPIPDNLHDLVDERLALLPAEALEALLFAAALTEPSVPVVGRALGRDAWTSLRPAVEANVVELDEEKIRFAHPLLASCLYGGVDLGRRREVHRKLADVVTDLEVRARHIALATEGADEDAASVLELAAAQARAQGAPATAGELLDEALRLTPPENETAWARRAVEAADSHWHAADGARGSELARAVIDRAADGPERTRALIWLAERDLAPDLADAALAEATSDAVLRARALNARAEAAFVRGDVREAVAFAERAVAAARASTDVALLVPILARLGLLEALRGHASGRTHLLEALELEEDAKLEIPYLGANGVLGVERLWADDLDEARSRLERDERRARETGDQVALEGLLFRLADLEWRAGDWARALRLAQEVIDLDEQNDNVERFSILHPRALVQAHLGDVESARRDSEEGLALAVERGNRLFELRHRSVLGFIQLSLGDGAAALDHLAPLRAILEEGGVGELGAFPLAAEEIDALLATDRFDEAEARLSQLADVGRARDRPRQLMVAHRGRGLLHARRGELEEALVALEVARAESDRLAVPFEQARTLLALGQTQRRARQKRLARESLERALALFERLGARLWAEKARDELARVGGRAPVAGALTPSERRVAELVAEGRSNKEVAATLFVAVKTVETNLSRIYAKLGIRSRTELASKFGGKTAAKL